MASITLTYSTEHATRILTALGKNQNLGRKATGAEYKAWVGEATKQMVFDQEDLEAKAAIVTERVEIT